MELPARGTVEVRCFTNLPEAELFLNGHSLGTRQLDDTNGYLSWQVEFESGTLDVRAAAEDGTAVADCIETVGAAAQIALEPWRSPASADDRIVQVEVMINDIAGQMVAGDRSKIEVSLEGPAELMGIESGDIADLTAYSSSYRHCYHGRAILYIRKSKGASESIRLTVRSENLCSAMIEL